ncbi:glycosyl transferase [Alicyclobacillus contaminans]|nr:glycosyl transferase [Alicyclobacillus contaminans]
MAPEVGQEYETEHEETPPLGQLLLQKGCITPQQLQAALAFQEKSGGKLGEILIALDFIKPRDLFNVLAEQLHFHRADVTEPVGVEHPLPAPLARRFNAIAIEEHGDTLRVAVSEPLSEEERSILSSYTSKQIEQVLATPYELERLWSQVYKRDLLAESINKLEMEQPQNSATRVLTRNQVMIFCLLVLGSILACCVSGKHYLFIVNVVCQSLYFFLAVFKAMIIYRGMNTTTHEVRPADISKLDEDKLPIYTILVPLFREANVLADLVRHIEALDYPKHKLDVRLLLEEDDTETIERAKQLKIPYYFTFVLVPNSHPRTKPKACNYGLIRARGDYVVIYDAEDRPEPDQLKKVLLTFQQAGPSVVCVQAKLNYFNGNQNLLTRWFTQEYSNWFGLLLPGVMALNIPVPLGGTSNHFRMSALKELNAWDPYNVTEDADLGVRLYKFGYQTAIVDSTTWEEANSQVRNWIRQRTRWIKGYIQTWLVHMRHPVQLYRDIGGRGFWGFQAMILGTPLLP